MSLVLASSSIYRKELLSRLGLDFFCRVPDVDETPFVQESAPDLVQRLSIKKVQAIAPNHPDSLIIGSDQIAELNGELLGKPNNHQEAVNQLVRASGSTVHLHTGIALLNTRNQNIQVQVVEYLVKYRELSQEIIENYLTCAKPYDCCGSLKSEGIGISLLERLSGDDPSALIGLPLIKLVDMLHNEGVDIF